MERSLDSIIHLVGTADTKAKELQRRNEVGSEIYEALDEIELGLGWVLRKLGTLKEKLPDQLPVC